MTTVTDATAQAAQPRTMLTKVGAQVWQSPSAMYTMRVEQSTCDGRVYAIYGPQGERQTYKSILAVRDAGFDLRVLS